MTTLTEHLTNAVEAETNVLQFTLPDHRAHQEKLAALHHDSIVKRTAEISKTKVSLRKVIEKLDSEIERLQIEKKTAKESAEALIAQDQRIIAASKAFIDALEGV